MHHAASTLARRALAEGADGGSRMGAALPTVLRRVVALGVAFACAMFAAAATAARGYDALTVADGPVAYWPLAGSAADLIGAHPGTFKGGRPAATRLPDGAAASVFNGSGEYMRVPSSGVFSIPTTGRLSWEAWIRPAVAIFPHQSTPDDYVDFIGKCADYSPTCEWEGRDYSTSTGQGRPNRVSAYVFNPAAGLGSDADWQPAGGVLRPRRWLMVVGEYQTRTTPRPCEQAYPGTINIWVDGVRQSFADHAPTGCMSQYRVAPTAGTSPLTIGTLATDTWFDGAIGDVAIFDRLLSQGEIAAQYRAMTGHAPAGRCANTCTL